MRIASWSIAKALSSGGARLAMAVGIIVVASVPSISAASPQQEPTPEQQQEDVQQRQGEVALQITWLEANNAEIQAALATLEENVATQLNEVDKANTAKAEADAALVAMNQAVDQMVVEAYMNPPQENSWDALSAENMQDAAAMQTLLDIQSMDDAEILEKQEQAQADAQAAKEAADAKLTELETAEAQQSQALADAELALDHKLTEAQNLATLDAQLAAEIQRAAEEQARQQEEARRRAEEEANAPPPPPQPDPDGITTVSCHDGGAIEVANELASNLQALLDAAAADGLALCGGGYRDPQQQIELRKAHCGTSQYAIYEMPASQCSPPTARPGTSQHEVGLAVDFRNCSSQSTACFQWLDSNAANYGMYNLPSEPWHWSTDGT